jgi:hypothetical protein
VTEACPGDDGGADRALLLGRDEGAHEVEHVGGEEGVEGAVVDAHGRALEDLDLGEAGAFEFGDEVTLRQGAGHSAGPGGGVGEDLGWELFLGDGEVGDGELAAGSQYAGDLGEHACLAWGEVDHAVGDDVVDTSVAERDGFDVALERLDVR